MNKLLAAAALLFVAACWSRNSEPLVGATPLNAQQQRGEVVFFQQCNECHPQGQAGLGPSLNDKTLPGALLRHQIRHPVAFMPEFSEADLPDDQLHDLIEYMKVARDADDQNRTDAE